MKKLILALLFLVALSPLASHAAFAKDPRVTQAEEWLSSLKTGQARFIQTGYDGSVLHGNFYINRPGMLRFEYDAPVQDFLVADGVLIHFFDAQQRQTSSAPIGSTLADFLLRKNPRLEGDLTVMNVRERNGLVSMTVSQTADPSSGQLTINFTKEPFALKSWSIHDAQGLETRISLTGLETGMALPPSLFIYKDPTGRSRLNN